MASPSSTRPEIRRTEAEILDRLLDLYADQEELYRKVLELSRRQGEAIRQGGSLASVRRLLEQKKSCLDRIGSLDRAENLNKLAWERGRRHWSAGGRAKVHEALHILAEIIEEILACEERNDMALIRQAKGY